MIAQNCQQPYIQLMHGEGMAEMYLPHSAGHQLHAFIAWIFPKLFGHTGLGEESYSKN